MFTEIIIVFVCFLAFLNVLPSRPAILGIYRQKQKYYYLKFGFIFTFLWIRKLTGIVREKLSKGKFQRNPRNEDIDKAQPLSSHINVCIYIYEGHIIKIENSETD